MGAETNEPVTVRIEAIRARHADRLRTRALPPDWALVNEDMAVLLAMLREASAELSGARERAERYATDANHAESHADKAEAQVQRVEEALDKQWNDVGDLYDAVSAALMEPPC